MYKEMNGIRGIDNRPRFSHIPIFSDVFSEECRVDNRTGVRPVRCTEGNAPLGLVAVVEAKLMSHRWDSWKHEEAFSCIERANARRSDGHKVVFNKDTNRQ